MYAVVERMSRDNVYVNVFDTPDEADEHAVKIAVENGITEAEARSYLKSPGWIGEGEWELYVTRVDNR